LCTIHTGSAGDEPAEKLDPSPTAPQRTKYRRRMRWQQSGWTGSGQISASTVTAVGTDVTPEQSAAMITPFSVVPGDSAEAEAEGRTES